ncbi:hypothetical protein ACFSKM_25790 [Ancylobacter dichloromethanicus]
MNLALKDTLHAPTRFVLTAFGVAFLVMAVIGMTGLYRGIVEDALLIIERIDADLWVVQGERAGPFAEGSAVAADMDRRVEGCRASQTCGASPSSASSSTLAAAGAAPP